MQLDLGKEKKIALVLGGGASRGAYEIGVWAAFRELEIPIHIVTGTSVGALNGALIVQNTYETAADLWEELTTDKVFDIELKEDQRPLSKVPQPKNLPFEVSTIAAYVKKFIKDGGTAYEPLKQILAQNLDEQAIRNASVEFGLVTVEKSSRRPKYLFKENIPEGQLLDYILASCAFYPALKTYTIDDIEYIDGGYYDNIPIEMAFRKGASTLFAVDLDTLGFTKKSDIEGREIHKIKSPWNLGDYLVFDQENSKRIKRLGFLDTMKLFEAFDGYRYTFVKGEMDKRLLNKAESAAYLFELSPETIYRRDVFHHQLRREYTKESELRKEEIAKITGELNLKKIAAVAKLFAQADKKALVIAITEQVLANKEAKKIFASKPVYKLFKEEVDAAAYLIRAKIPFL